jgi:large repetitive protein
VLGNDTDLDGDTLTAALVTNVIHGSLTLNANGGFTYTPSAGYNNTYSIGVNNTATVTIADQ